MSLQKKDVDALSMYGTEIYSQGKTASFKIAASESKADRKFHFKSFQSIEGRLKRFSKNPPPSEDSTQPLFVLS